HPLRHADLIADRRVTLCPRTYFAGDHLAGVQPDPQRQVEIVALSYGDGEVTNVLLNVQCRHASANCVVLQRHRRPEDGHHAVAGEFVDGSAVTRHDVGAAVEQLGHQLAKPLGTHRRRNVHRMHDVCEKHGHLLVLCSDAHLGYDGTALVAE